MEAIPSDRIAGMRQFNRFYTRQIGLLRQGLLETPYSLSEARVLYEIAQGETTAAALAQGLGLDPAFLSRLLRRLGFPRPRRAHAVGDRSAGGDPRPDRGGPRRVRHARPPLAAAHRGPARASRGDAAVPARRGDAGDRGAARRSRRAVGRRGDPAVSRRRSRLGARASRPVLCRGIRVRPRLRAIGRADRRRVPRPLRPRARSLLDRGDRRRAGRHGHAGRRRRRASPSSASSSSSRARAATGSDEGSSRNASASPGRPATARSRCGPRASWSRRERSISAAALRRSPRSRTGISASISSARPGRWICTARSPHERSDMRGFSLARWTDVVPGCRFAHPGYVGSALITLSVFTPSRPAPWRAADARRAAA